jgi:hypothetical protein
MFGAVLTASGLVLLLVTLAHSVNGGSLAAVLVAGLVAAIGTLRIYLEREVRKHRHD